MVLMLGQKATAVPKLSYLHVSRLKKHNWNLKKLFNFRNLVSLKGSTFHLKDKKNSDIETLRSKTYAIRENLFTR